MPRHKDKRMKEQLVEPTNPEIEQIAASSIAVGDVVAGGSLGCVARKSLAVKSNGQSVDLELEMRAGRPARKVSLPASEVVLRFSLPSEVQD